MQKSRKEGKALTGTQDTCCHPGLHVSCVGPGTGRWRVSSPKVKSLFICQGPGPRGFLQFFFPVLQWHLLLRHKGNCGQAVTTAWLTS